MEEVSYLDLDKKIADMQAVKKSLAREINQNQLDALNLRDELKAFQTKVDEQKTEIKKLDAILLNRKQEISTIDNLLDKERKIIDAEKRDLISLRESVSGEQAVWSQEKTAALAAIDERIKKIARQEVSAMNRLAEIEAKEKMIAGELEEISRRRINVNEAELKANAVLSDAQQVKLEAEKLSTFEKRALEEAEAKSKAYDALMENLRSREAIAADKESNMKVAYNDIELRKKDLDERERDIVIAESKLREMRVKTIREIEHAKIEADRKKAIKNEAENVEIHE